MIGLNAAPGAFLGLLAEGTGQVAGLTFTQDLVITAIPVVGGIITALAVEVRRHRRGAHEAATDEKLRAELDARDEELHVDLRRQITRLERQLDDLARTRGGPLRGDHPPDGAA